jgi:hypothetical protein
MPMLRSSATTLCPGTGILRDGSATPAGRIAAGRGWEAAAGAGETWTDADCGAASVEGLPALCFLAWYAYFPLRPPRDLAGILETSGEIDLSDEDKSFCHCRRLKSSPYAGSLARTREITEDERRCCATWTPRSRRRLFRPGM